MSGFEPTATGAPSSRRPPMVWGACRVEGSEVVVRVSGWRRALATRSTLRFPLASIVRIDHDPLARAHVKTGFRQWRKHGSGVWRVGVYHGLDGWSFWSIGLGRNAVLIECSGQRFRYVVIEVADAAQTVREIRTAAGKVTQRIPGGLATAPPPVPQVRSRRRARRDPNPPATGQD
jgi:hypothetical protein